MRKIATLLLIFFLICFPIFGESSEQAKNVVVEENIVPKKNWLLATGEALSTNLYPTRI